MPSAVRAIGLSLCIVLCGCSPRIVEVPQADAGYEPAVVPAVQVEAGRDRFPISVDRRWGYIDSAGRVVIEPRFTEAYPFSEGLARVAVGGPYGYIDPQGAFAIEPRFVQAFDFSRGRARVVLAEAERKQQGRSVSTGGQQLEAFIDPAGGMVVSATLAEARDFAASAQGPLAPVVRTSTADYYPLGFNILGLLRWRRQQVGPWEVIREDGSTAFELAEAQNVLGYSENRSPVALKIGGWPLSAERWGYLDANGALAIEPRFEMAYGFSEGRAAVVADEQVGYIDANGAPVVPPQFERGRSFREGRAAVRGDGRWGYLDRSGVLAIPLQFDWATDFSQGRALVQQGDRFGFIGPDGDVAIPIRYDYARPFRHGLAFVRDGDREGYVDTTGTFIWSQPFTPGR